MSISPTHWCKVQICKCSEFGVSPTKLCSTLPVYTQLEFTFNFNALLFTLVVLNRGAAAHWGVSVRGDVAHQGYCEEKRLRNIVLYQCFSTGVSRHTSVPLDPSKCAAKLFLDLTFTILLWKMRRFWLQLVK